MKDFFISYNKADRAWAEWIAWQLEKEAAPLEVRAKAIRAAHKQQKPVDIKEDKDKRTVAK